MTVPAGAGTPVAAAAPSQVELERRLYRRQRGRRSIVVSVVSTLVVIAIAYFGVVNTPGWAAVQQSFFDPQTAIDTFPDILLGLWLNVRILFFSAIGVAVFGTLLAVVRGLRNPVFFPLRTCSAACRSSSCSTWSATGSPVSGCSRGCPPRSGAPSRSS